MNCNECNYNHTKIEMKWEYRKEESNNNELTFAILSRYYEAEILEEIMHFALSLRKPPIEIYLDTYYVDTHGCSRCLSVYFKNGLERDRAKKRLSENGILLQEFF